MSNPNISRAAKPAARAAAKPAAKTTNRPAAKPVARAAAKPAAKAPVLAAAKPAAKAPVRAAAKPAAKKPVAKKVTVKVAVKGAAPARAVISTEKLYKMLTGLDDGAFCQKVTDHIEAGYTLHGSPTMTVKGNQIWVGQAVTRKPKAKPKAKGKKK